MLAVASALARYIYALVQLRLGRHYVTVRSDTPGGIFLYHARNIFEKSDGSDKKVFETCKPNRLLKRLL